MKVTRRSLQSGIQRTLELDITQEQIDLYTKGTLSQIAFPNLSPDEREFFMTGITSEEWNSMFAE